MTTTFRIFLVWGACQLLAMAKPNVIVIFADDMGYADLSCQNQEPDVRTPNIDRLAGEGVRFTAGYVTAPQCSPSRAGLMIGRYQQRIGIDTIPDVPLPLESVTIAEMMTPAGYMTGQVGKWHLEPNRLCQAWASKHLKNAKPTGKGDVVIPVADRIAYMPVNQGFAEYFTGEMSNYYCNYTLQGDLCKPGFINTKGFRVDTQTDAALSFIRRNREKPFFLYLAYFTPHTPLELVKPYVDQFPESMPTRRRAALSMIAGMDAGIGRIEALLKQLKLDDNTLIVFASDNGAPLHHCVDAPLNGDAGGWDGSLNTPWIGEKGMLAEGGIRVPFFMRWPGKIPGGRVVDTPVSTLDVAPTVLAAAGASTPTNLDGSNLLPLLRDPSQALPERSLYWRFWNQIACRKGRWKYLCPGNRTEFLFDLGSDANETKNLAAEHPDILAALRTSARKWADELTPPGVAGQKLNPQESAVYRQYFQLGEQ